MSDSHSIDIDKHVRTYILVFVSLMVLILSSVLIRVSALRERLVKLCIKTDARHNYARSGS